MELFALDSDTAHLLWFLFRVDQIRAAAIRIQSRLTDARAKKKYYYFHLQVSPTRCLVSRDQNVKKEENVGSRGFKAHSRRLPPVWCVCVAEKAPKAGLLINQNDPLKMKLLSLRAAAVPGRWSVLFSSQLRHRIVDAGYWGGTSESRRRARRMFVWARAPIRSVRLQLNAEWFMNSGIFNRLKRRRSSLFCSSLL